MEPLTDDIWNALSALLANETNNGERARICHIYLMITYLIHQHRC